MRTWILICGCLIYFFGVSPGPVLGAIPSFPGAQGFGATTPGGRGGKVIHVTSLSDSGTGSLREALKSSGSRIVVFDIGGIISLNGNILIDNPNITIAGQTAPGDGITIKNAGIVVQTHDVIIRGLRIRPGDDRSSGLPDVGDRDGLKIFGDNKGAPPSSNVLVDHNSFSWGTDENISVWFENVKNVTIQWNIISEAIDHEQLDQGRGLLVGVKDQNISVHHNLFAHNSQRNPMWEGGTSIEAVNNIVYNWDKAAMHFQGPTNAGPILGHLIGNYFKPGRDTNSPDSLRGHEFFIATETNPNTRFYITGNYGPHVTNPSADNWPMVDAVVAGTNVTNYKSNSPLFTSLIKADPVFDIYNTVLQYSGARLPKIDSIDSRVIQSVKDGSGKNIRAVSDVGGYPNYSTVKRPADYDTDRDGMPNQWEQQQGLNPNSDDSAGDKNGDGYTNIENYINSLITFPGTGPPPTPIPTGDTNFPNQMRQILAGWLGSVLDTFGNDNKTNTLDWVKLIQ